MFDFLSYVIKFLEKQCGNDDEQALFFATSDKKSGLKSIWFNFQDNATIEFKQKGVQELTCTPFILVDFY